MKLFNRISASILLLTVASEFSADAQTTVFSNAPSATRAIPRRSSIILIVANGIGYGDLSCYGQQKFQTPNLDKLAADGVRFTNYFGENDSSKSQAEFMFGKNSVSDEMTVAQILKNSGYHTGMVGEWDLGDEHSALAPWQKGFDEFLGCTGALDDYAAHLLLHEPARTFSPTEQREDFTGPEEVHPNVGGAKGQYIPDLLTKAAMNFAKNNEPDRFNHYRPFFLLLNYEIPDSGNVPSDAPYSDEPWPQPEKNKAAMISRLDGYVGQIREQLKNLGMTNNVAIFFTSGAIAKKINGVDPIFFHSNISTNDLRAPMIICWPGNIPAGQVSGWQSSAKDFLPTATEIGFAKTPEKMDGNSLLPELRKRK